MKQNELKKTVCFTYLTALIIAELIDVSYLSSLTEKHSEDSVWRRHHQQRRLSGEFEEINVFYLHVFCSSVRHILVNLICQEYVEGASLN